MKLALNKTNLIKVGKGSLLAGGGAALTYLLTALPSLDIPEALLPLITAGFAVAINYVRKLLKQLKGE